MLLVAVLATVTYLPALQSGWIWDDDSYILDNPAVQLPEGIVHAWVPGATPQYYPLVFVSFWVQHAVHGLEPFGYHLVNLLLHLASSVLLWRLLVALRLPGALFAAALFAVHPVQVETVAWVTERKNVLSMAFSLASLLAWVRFLQDTRPFSARAGWWGASFVLFALAMLSKTTAVAVPVTMAAIAWWQPWTQGTLTPAFAKSDRAPSTPRKFPLTHSTLTPVPATNSARSILALVLPFFAVGIALGLFTAWVEATFVGARGAEFARPALDRLLQAAQAWWFYLGTWCWPRGLMFVYPAFDGPAWLPWFALLSGLSVAVAAITAMRRGVRGAMVAFLCYSAAIFPALGFINLYPLRFAPVADHFGYAASAVLAPVAAWCLVRAWRVINDRGAPCAIGSALAVVLVASLAVMARGHTAKFANVETLWRTTLADNPRAWLASNNLVSMLLTNVQESIDAGDTAARDRALDEAARLAEISVELAGTIDMPVQSNMSEVRRLQGRLPEALTALNAALLLEPNAPGPHWQRGRIIELRGDFAGAESDYARAVELSPRNGIYLREWVRWLTKSGRLREAREIAARIVAVDPGDAESLANLGAIELEIGEIPAARRDLRRALTMASGPLATVIAVRCARACLAPPVDPESAMQARAIAEQLVRETDGVDPLAFVLLARAQATLGDPKARETLARADALLSDASAEVMELAAPERAATEALLSASSPAATLSR